MSRKDTVSARKLFFRNTRRGMPMMYLIVQSQEIRRGSVE